jgi:hypothetical protein
MTCEANGGVMHCEAGVTASLKDRSLRGLLREAQQAHGDHQNGLLPICMCACLI